MFVIGFAGCIGSIRESRVVLLVYCVALGVIFLLELAVVGLGFIFKDKLLVGIKKQLLLMVAEYREDPDLQNIIDWVQQDWLHCCGVTSPKDWDRNEYFNCSAPTPERCGVPFSCCVVKDQTDNIVNKQCGYDTRDVITRELIRNDTVFTRGCLAAGEAWLAQNLLPVIGAAVGVAAVQLCGCCMGLKERRDVASGEL